MKLTRKLFIVLLSLLVLGIAKMPFEQKLTEQLREQNLLNKPLNIETRERIGQTSAVVSLGGLRSIVAAMLNLRAHVHFENQQWYDLKDTIENVTTLQPRSPFYWESGGWHLAYNASIDFRHREDLPEARRRILWREFIHAGSDFMEKGSRLNPDNWRIKAQLAKLWADPHKIVDIPRAVEYLKDIGEIEGVLPYYPRQYMYLLTRTPGREKEALAEGQKLFHASEKNRLPTLLCCIFVLQNKLNTPESEAISFLELFGSNENGYKALSDFSARLEEYPQTGIAEKLKKLKSLLGE